MSNHATHQTVPYWNEIKRLDKEDKLKLMALISSSLVSDEKDISEKDRTQEMIDCFCGSWVGKESAEDIIANIENSRSSHYEPVKF